MRSHIVIVSPSYGGAEKRFFDIFTVLRRHGSDVHLIAPSSLIDRLKIDHPDRQDVFTALIAVPMRSWSRIGFIVAFFKVLRTIPRRGSFHYPVNCLWPLHLNRGDQVSMSMVDCTKVPSPMSGTLTAAWSWLAFFFVRHVDVLSPTILEAMRHYRMAPKMSLTPGGTFLALPRTAAPQPKQPTVVFLGRLVPGKGIDDLMDLLPQAWSLLRDKVPTGFGFQIAGYGPLESHVVGRVGELARAGVPVRFVGYALAEQLFEPASVGLSLQEVTNYPSRVVAEALCSGCAVIIRDTGDSRQFGTDLPGLEYCTARLDASELARLVSDLLNRVLHEPGFSDSLRDAARERFSSPQYINYFRGLLGESVATNTNVDQKVIEDFGAEWARFDQAEMSESERERLFSEYFAIFPWQKLPSGAVGMDVGCGSGRWAKSVAPRVGRLILVDPAASALGVARRNLAEHANVSFHQADTGNLPIPDATLDFAYSLGVLHHIPDTARAMHAVVRKLKPGAPLLVYLYYALDARPSWYRALWRVSDVIRPLLAAAPRPIKNATCEAIAASVYWPLARGALLAERLGFNVANFPLQTYRNLSYYVMRTDALDRFGTRLEQRFTRRQIQSMMEGAGLTNIVFHERQPFWCALGYRAPTPG